MNENFDTLMECYENLKREIRNKDKHLYERWKAGGFLVDTDIMSMYPNLTQVMEELNDQSDDEDEEEELDA